MRLLLTRSTEDAERSRRTLVAMGHHVTVAPVIHIVATGAVWPGGLADAVLATSAHAFCALPKGVGPPPEARRLLPLLLVGARTEDAARRRGFEGEAIVAASAADLAKVVETMTRDWRRIVYLAGRDRKPNAEAALIAKGRIVDVVETYEAEVVEGLAPAARIALRAGLLDGVLHFSRRSAALFLVLMRKEGFRADALRHFCLSEDIASLLREAGCDCVEAADTPDERAMSTLLAGDADADRTVA